MNKARLKKIAERIVAQPQNFYMPFWRAGSSTLRSRLSASAMEARAALGTCGTACCVAGHALEIAAEEGRISPHEIPGQLDSSGWQTKGADELGLTEDQASRLFMPIGWPTVLKARYKAAMAAGDWAEAACVGAERIKVFCDSDGEI